MRPDYPDLFISPTPQIESPLHWDTDPVKLKELLTALDVDKAISTLSGIESDISAWSYVPKNNDETGGQIDLVIQRADRVSNLCEMKYSSAPFVIKNSYMEEMRVRRELFRSKTKTSYTLSLTVVSPYGVQGNKYAGDLGPVVTMDDLFASE